MALWRGKPVLTYLRRGVLLEAIQYLLLIPFIIQWIVFSGRTAELTLISYSLQIALITPTLLVLYFRLRQPYTDQIAALKAAAVAAAGI